MGRMTQAQLSLRFENDGSISARFAEFHAQHPEVYAHLRSLALDLRSRGWRHYGIRSLWERTRWHFQVEREMGEDFVLNDHFPAHYSRKLMEEEPGLHGFFEVRKLRA